MLKENYKNLLPDMDSWLIPRENGMLLSDYHISILQRNGINYLEYGSIKELLFAINDILEEDDNDELEEVAKDLDEKNYYKNVNK
ncbi:MAG: hypothetical protein IKR74_02515 [Bacilli bacterium]|nr:hypothetical protein [Bacilli bacterium]